MPRHQSASASGLYKGHIYVHIRLDLGLVPLGLGMWDFYFPKGINHPGHQIGHELALTDE